MLVNDVAIFLYKARKNIVVNPFKIQEFRELVLAENLPPRRFLIPLLPVEFIEPRDSPAIELLRLRWDLSKESLSLKRFMETSSD